MTCNTSEVAVCCSSASFVSLNNRAFSIAITAWSANVLKSSISLSANDPGWRREVAIVPIATPLRSIGTTRTLRKPRARAAFLKSSELSK